MEVKVSRKDGNLHIKWQLSQIDIPISNIKEVSMDDTYSGEEKMAVRIGLPYGHTDRVVIKTRSKTYILYTSNGGLKEKILSYMEAS
ncbi:MULTISPECIES: PH domain-containing protein [Bacillaceae]|uniref:SunI/YnzG family protein n=1 Tax=Bacillaceae TaxID=186817 RepID=UPI001C55ED86|nr:PH domain-containing protein [Rossellomorea sp. YZS02]MBW3112333.1 PH domain-containing protein [Bacillus sp. MCCB 382]MDX8342462.1 PH domain-containing protein [Rossellomorea sp. YZS02]